MVAPSSAYIHIPFCRHRCYYCDFPVTALGGKTNPETTQIIPEYVKFLLQEILATPKLGPPLTTIFFGGGTPSLLPVKYFEQILSALDQQLGIADGAEISLEMDPGTFNREQLRGYLKAGVNRISLGVQAFQQNLLTLSGRSHNLEDTWRAVDLIRQENCSNFSLDLISGLPQQSLEDWHESLTMAIAIKPQHISCYDLVVEPVTAFGRFYQPGEKPLPSDQTTVAMYRLGQSLLTGAGYQHYEISNYALPGHQCRHNLVYWRNLPYYAFGMGAASYLLGARFIRPRKRGEYYSWVDLGCEIQGESVGQVDWILETLMLGLRLGEGVKLPQFDPPTRAKILTAVIPYQRLGQVVVEGDTLKLQDPDGFLFSNTILSTLFNLPLD